MRSYEGRATILIPGCPPLRATLVIDDITTPSWTGIVRLLDGGYEAGPTEHAQVVLEEPSCPGLSATARVMVPRQGLPGLRGHSRFVLAAGAVAAGA